MLGSHLCFSRNTWLLCVPGSMFTLARGALAHDLPEATAGGAGGHGLHLAEKGALHPPHLAAAAAGRTGPVLAAFSAHELGHPDLLLRAVRDLLQRHLQPHAKVAALHGAAPPALTEPAAERPTETFAEDVAELGEDVLHVHAATLEATTSHAGSVVAEAIVFRLLVGIAQDLVRAGRLLELLLGGLVTRVLVRMVLDRQLAVGLFYVLRAGVPPDSEHCIWVKFRHALLIRPRPPWRSG